MTLMTFTTDFIEKHPEIFNEIEPNSDETSQEKLCYRTEMGGYEEPPTYSLGNPLTLEQLLAFRGR